MKNFKISAIIVFTAVLLFGGTSTAQTQSDTGPSANKVILRGGYFIPLRSKFRDLYGNQFNGRARYERSLNERISAGLDINLIILKRSEDKVSEPSTSETGLKYRNLSIAPYIHYYLVNEPAISIYTGVGLGMNFRRVSVDIYMYSPEGDHLGWTTIEQNDFGPSAILELGLDWRISSRLFINPALLFDYVYDSNTDIGGFGNTGGLNLTLGLGMQF